MNASLSLFLLAVVAVLVAATIALHLHDRERWRRSLQPLKLSLPRDLDLDDAVHWLGLVAAITHPPRWSLFPLPPVVIEVQATSRGITHYLLADPMTRAKLVAGIQATLPGARIDELPEGLPVPEAYTLAAECAMTSRLRPLATGRTEVVSAGLLAALQPLSARERITLQLMITSAGTPPPVPTKPTAGGSLPWWLDSSAPRDADAVHARRDKQREPLLAATIRFGVVAGSERRAAQLLARPWSMVQGLNAPGVKLVWRLVPAALVARRLRERRYPIFRWPLLLNVREAVALAAFPFAVYLPGLALGRARQLPPAPSMPRRGNVVGVSNYPGIAGRALALRETDRLRHVHLIAPTGTGKSTLIAQMVLQDIAAGHGVVVVDPKGDLVTDIAARVPAERSGDVVVLDPSEVAGSVIGFNPLRTPAHDELARELAADQVLNIFHSIYHEFWGPRTDEVMRAALFSLTHTRAPDGSAFTIIEVPELLTNAALRRYVSTQSSLPASLRAFWQWFDGLSEGDRSQMISPVLNKLRAFSMRSSIRLMLGQSRGITLGQRFSRGGILLISLAKGKIGAEAANLLGSLFVSMLWQTTQARVRLPAERRAPVFAYLDEFQDIVRLGAGNNLADMLAQARGLGLSLTLAHQYLSQLPTNVREATLGTVRSHVAFQLEWDDARALEARFAPLTRDDLAGLASYEFALKPCVDGQTLAPVTGLTLPLGDPINNPRALALASRERYGLRRADIEAGLQARLAVGGTGSGGRFGREAVGGKP